jgi:hypothetical protein
LAGVIQADKRPALTLLLFLLSGLLVWLFVILFYRIFRIGKTHRKVLDLQRRLDEADAKKREDDEFFRQLNDRHNNNP